MLEHATAPATATGRPAPGAGNAEFDAQTIAALRAHPDFPEAARRAAVGSIEAYRSNRLLNTLINDRGRSSVSFLALYLHRTARPDDDRSGLTVSRLKDLCADQAICSPGRIEAFVAVLRLVGHLERAPGGNDRRIRRLVPTERLVAALRLRFDGVLAAMTLLMPSAAQARAALHTDADFESALIRRLGDALLAGFRPLQDDGARALFGERNAGLMMAMSLTTAAGPARILRPTPVTVSISALARQYSVSRVHVRTLLRDATAAGYLARTQSDDGSLVVLPPLGAMVETFFANSFLMLDRCAAAAFAEVAAAHGAAQRGWSA